MRRAILHINSGICKCGCSWEDHHLSFIMNGEVIVAIKLFYEKNFPDRVWPKVNGYPLYVPEECEAHGFNELGGKKLNSESGEYEDHCHSYEDKDGPLGEVYY